MVDVVLKVFSWFWTFSWIIMLIPSNFRIMFGFTNVTWTTRTISFIDNTWFAIVFIFKRRQRSYISSFPPYYHSETIVGEFVKYLQKMFWFNFIQFTAGYFNECERFCIFQQTSWNYKTFISTFFTLLKFINVSFWTPNSPTSMVLINSTFTGKTQNYLHHGPPKLQNAINEIQSMVIFIVQKEYHQTLMKKSLW